MMEKIALIYMGGTFGCVGEPLAPMSEHDFLPLLAQHIVADITVQCFAAAQIKDSSACTAADWLVLIQQIQQLQLHGFQHFVIIHGTDTLSYAAATLARFLGHSCHVVLTGSQYPLLNVTGSHTREFSDALGNLHFALQQIEQQPAGVYLAFQQQIFHAQSSLKIHTSALDAFAGIAADQPFASATQAIRVQQQHIAQAEHFNLLSLMLQPIMPAQLLTQLENMLPNPPQFLVLQAFGSGNIAINNDILALFDSLYLQRCICIISSQVPFGTLAQHYAVSTWMQTAKVLMNDGHSHADLYAKALQMYLKYPTHPQRFEQWAQH